MIVPFKFSKSISTAFYGAVKAGQTVEVSEADADRYARAGWGAPVPVPAERKGPGTKTNPKRSGKGAG